MHRIRITILIAALAGSLLAFGCHKKPSDGPALTSGRVPATPPTPVVIAIVERTTLENTIPITGSLAALQDVQLSAKAEGRVVAVNAREGDYVHKGEVLVAQDVTDLQANVAQAQAGIQSALAKVSQAISNEQIQVTGAREGVQQAQAQVAGAKQNLLKLQRGARPQEVLQGQNSLLSAKASRDNALITLNRDKSLFQQGAIAKAELDTAQTSYDVSVAQYKNAQQALSLTVEGSRREDVASAQDQLSQQETVLQNAIANVRLVSVRRDDILAAQAAVAQAKATLAFNEQQLANAYIRSPFDGLVATRSVEPGQIASPGTPLMQVVNVKTVYYEPTISETDYTDVHTGTPVQVNIDAYPGRTFNGTVAAVFPAANTSDRGFTLRVNVPNPNNVLRPGMFARGSLVSKIAKDVTVVPTSALVTTTSGNGLELNTSSNDPINGGLQEPSQHVVVVSEAGTAEIRPVRTGITNMSSTQIVSGVTAGEKIVVIGQSGLQSGDKVVITNQNLTGSSRNTTSRTTPTG